MPKYTLEELLAQCDPTKPIPVLTEWAEMVPVGREIIDQKSIGMFGDEKDNKPMRIFFDTEFTDLGIDPKLISIGLVEETGERTFYAELSDTYTPDDCGDFAREVVLPKLEGGSARMAWRTLCERLTAWLESFGEPVVLATDSLAWDWPWIQEVFYEMESWPANVEKRPLLLTMNHVVNFDQFTLAVEDAFAGGLRRHHSLDDARANRLGWIAAGGSFDWR